MSDHTHEFDSDADRTPIRPGQLSSNGHWVFGSIFAGLTLIGFSFGVWAGASKTKAPEVAEVKPKEPSEKPVEKPVQKAVVPPAVVPPKAETPVADPPKPDPPKPDPIKPEPVKPDPPKPDPPKPDPVKPVPPKTEPPKPPAKPVVFKEVVPILRTYCFDCHGAAGKPKGEVDVTTVAKLLKSKGPPLVAGKPDQSSLYLSVKSGDMPPDGKKGPSEKELQLLYDWIAGGAKERRRHGPTARGRRRKLELTEPAGGG